MPLAEPTDLIVILPKKLFSDISNMVNSPSSVNVKEVNLEKCDLEKKFSARHNPDDFCFSYEQAMQQENDRLTQLRGKIEKPVIQEVCNRIHHSTYSLDDLVESIENYLEDFYIKGENVEFTPGTDRTVSAKVMGVEKKGGAVFYTLLYDDKEIGRINGRDLKRRYQITEDDIRSLILLLGSQQPGKPWQIEDEYKKEYGVKDKLAPIFCSLSHSKSSNKIVNTTGRSTNAKDGDSDSDDTPLVNFLPQRRSGVALPPNASSKEVDKQRKKQEKREQKEKKKGEKKEKERKENGSGDLTKFISPGCANGEHKSDEGTGTPFLTPQKRSEKRFNSAVSKLQDAWRKRDEQEFINAAAWSAKVLSGVQIEKIPHECHRFAVRKAYDKVKDAEALKKMRTKEERAAFREKMHEQRHQHQKIMLAKIKAYFSQEIAEEDIVVNDAALPCPGRPISVPSEQSLLLTDCVKLAHFNARLHEFSIEDNTVSELCRALLIGSTVDEKSRNTNDNAEPSTQNGVENEDAENGVESGRNTPCDLNEISQIDIDVCKTFLHSFTPDKELWELAPEDQLGILGLVLNRVLDLRSFKDYISRDGVSEAARNLRDKITKLNEQVNSWQEELSAMPEYEEVADPSMLSRKEARERADNQKQRESLERRIEENKDKVEELLEKLTLERLAKNQSKRMVPIGEDRHFRRYYWFHGKSADDGIWIQDLGVTSYEKFIRACIKAGKPFEEEQEVEDVKNEEPEVRLLSVDGDIPADVKISDWPVLEPESYTETWYRVPDVMSFDSLLGSLMKAGIREGKLLAFLKKNKDAILNSITGGSARQSKTPDPIEVDGEDEDVSSESLTPLRKSIVQLASDLRDSYLTSIGSVENFEAEVLCCTTLDEVKEKLRELADSITPSAIVRRLEFKVAAQTGQYSCLIMDRWKQRLAECQNVSGVHLLRSYLDSRIDWKKSIVEKRCNSCGSRRSPEAKIACASCSVVVHFYCTRPRLQDKPTSWLCPMCERVEAKKKKEELVTTRGGKAPRKEVDAENSSAEESSEDESEDSESDEDDFFANKHPRRSSRKRMMEDYFEDDVEDRKTRAKRAKVNPVAEECSDLLSRVKAYNRLYRTLQNIPAARSSRRAPPPSLDGLEESIPEYTSLSTFAADLNTFFRHARSYLEEHNERKLEELETLLFELDLNSLAKSH
ncbi:PHD-type domain-containing protein [Trichostrongylus colubriformis]|uniref:PHD-type domain-containing protein n=1 Tax=Trichostrongylus colubriformis TaxID=6319 RepID=A0AAN8F9N1_TRICO